MRQKIKERGFTLVEVLTSIFIIVVISGIIFANYRQSNRQYALLRSANKLAQDIRRAQQMAMGAKEYKGMVPQGGYGIYIELVQEDLDGDGTLEGDEWVGYNYTLFADCTDDDEGNYTPPPATPCNGFPEDIENEYIRLEKGVWICGVCSGNTSTIVFTPPNPLVTITPDPGPGGTTPIILRNKQNQTETVRVNHAGLIYVE